MLKEGLLKLGINYDEKTIPLLTRYIEEIELFNPAYGLVKVNDRKELIIKHILDSLAPVNILNRLLKERFDEGQIPAVADIGSGAGLPGIPLAVCMPGANFTLIERMGRRAGFLRNVLAVLGLSNVCVEEKDIDELAHKPTAKGSFNLIVFRAWKPLSPPLLKSLFTQLAPGGTIAAYKGRRETIEEEIAGLAAKSTTVLTQPDNLTCEVIPLKVPFLEEERHLVLIRSEK
ncbi:MAG: 16S rRNA (guanine(527)-N(7))-methyltransferase RsmG [Treponema sp.]|nr:16S rRNA (guanine(527)-N(7))-methyltransferase RsmG [Treponema sp.]MCL2130151.1 16S rRNA (guanine(527)-N(7))-methyltransferase RsmG [Treponema sp.]